MKTKLMGLLIVLFAVMISTTTKAQSVNVDNQLPGCSITATVYFYLNATVCGSAGPLTVAAGSSQVFTGPSVCAEFTAFEIQISNAGGAVSPPVTATSNGVPVGFTCGTSCLTGGTATVYNNGPNNFKVY